MRTLQARPIPRGRKFRSLLRLVAAALLGCGDSNPAAPGPGSESERVLAHLTVSGSPEAEGGATWIYRDTVDGVAYDMSGVLLKPPGTGPFPAVIVSHGFGGSAANYSRNVGRTMVGWGAVVIATNYTHAANGPAGAPGSTAELGASAANVRRARRLAELLRALGYVDMTRVAAHGHSMGAFVTTALAATHPELLRAASHTAGGVSAGATPGPIPTEAQGQAIRTPYQIHHGDRDFVVALAADQRLSAILVAAGTTHELHVYAGSDHNDVAFSAAVLDRVRLWYARHGVF
jgi:dienelactone hydrolase